MTKQFVPPAAALREIEDSVRRSFKFSNEVRQQHLQCFPISKLHKIAVSEVDAKVSSGATSAAAFRTRRLEKLVDLGFLPGTYSNARELDDRLHEDVRGHVGFFGHQVAMEYKRRVPEFAAQKLPSLFHARNDPGLSDKEHAAVAAAINTRQELLSEWCVAFPQHDLMAPPIRLMVSGKADDAFFALEKVLSGTEKTLQIEAKAITRAVAQTFSR